MRTRFVLFVASLLIAGHAMAQTPPRPSQPAPVAQPAQAPQPAQNPAPANVAAPAPPPPPAPPGPPRREGQPINVRVELTIVEEGPNAAPIRKSVIAVVGDGYNGYVRETGFGPSSATAPFPNRPVPLNLDAFPVILANGKIRLTCAIQYNAGTASGPSASSDARSGTDIKQNLVLILENGKALTISEATDPISDRKVTVEVKATILR
jgi:hypothetical protein